MTLQLLDIKGNPPPKKGPGEAEKGIGKLRARKRLKPFHEKI